MQYIFIPHAKPNATESQRITPTPAMALAVLWRWQLQAMTMTVETRSKHNTTHDSSRNGGWRRLRTRVSYWSLSEHWAVSYLIYLRRQQRRRQRRDATLRSATNGFGACLPPLAMGALLQEPLSVGLLLCVPHMINLVWVKRSRKDFLL